MKIKKISNQKTKITHENLLKVDLRDHIDEILKANRNRLYKQLSKHYLNTLETYAKDNKISSSSMNTNHAATFGALYFKLFSDEISDLVDKVLYLEDPKTYLAYYDSFPAHTNLLKLNQNQALENKFQALTSKLPQKLKAEYRKHIDSESIDNDFHLKFVEFLESNPEADQFAYSLFLEYRTIAIGYIFIQVLNYISKTPKDSPQPLGSELWKVVALDKFFKKPIPNTPQIEVITDVTEKELNALPLLSGNQLIYDDLLTFAKLKKGLGQEYQTIIESGFAILHRKGRERRIKKFTFKELAKFMKKTKSDGTNQYVRLAEKFIDLTKIWIKDEEGHFKLFTPVGIKDPDKFISFNFGTESPTLRLVERTFFEMPSNTYAKFTKHIHYHETVEYFQLESFSSFITRKINTAAIRNSNFVDIPQNIRLSLETLTDDAGVTFDYNKNPGRELSKLIKYFQDAQEKGIIETFHLTTFEAGKHIKHELTNSKAPSIKKIKANRKKIYFNFSLSKWQKRKILGDPFFPIPF